MSNEDTSRRFPWSRFAARLVAARLRAGLTQKGLAERCGRTSNSWVAQLENGTSQLPKPLDEVLLLAQQLGTPVEWLLFGKVFALGDRKVAIGLGGEAIDASNADLAVHPGACPGADTVPLLFSCHRTDISGARALHLIDCRGTASVAIGRVDAGGRLTDDAGLVIARGRVVGVLVEPDAVGRLRQRRRT